MTMNGDSVVCIVSFFVSQVGLIVVYLIALFVYLIACLYVCLFYFLLYV
jgi:hypothetical protein